MREENEVLTQWSLIAYMRQHGKEVSRGRKGDGKAKS